MEEKMSQFHSRDKLRYLQAKATTLATSVPFNLMFVWGFVRHRNQDNNSNAVLWFLQDILAQQACLNQRGIEAIPKYMQKCGSQRDLSALWILTLSFRFTSISCLEPLGNSGYS